MPFGLSFFCHLILFLFNFDCWSLVAIIFHFSLCVYILQFIYFPLYFSFLPWNPCCNWHNEIICAFSFTCSPSLRIYSKQKKLWKYKSHSFCQPLNDRRRSPRCLPVTKQSVSSNLREKEAILCFIFLSLVFFLVSLMKKESSSLVPFSPSRCVLFVLHKSPPHLLLLPVNEYLPL